MSRSITVAALTQGKTVPSTRFRWNQYEEDLVGAGLSIKNYDSAFGAYAPSRAAHRPFWIAKTLTGSLSRSILSRSADVCFLQRNLVATLYTWERILRKPIIFDVDDAIFTGPRGNSAFKIAQQAAVILCGNSYLAENFSRFGPVEILPTAVDTERYMPIGILNDEEIVIGWSGTSGGFQYLYDIEDALYKVLIARPKSILKIVSDRRPDFSLIPHDKVKYESWTEDTEVTALQSFSIGIMPLIDDHWSRGKCSFKMLTYMAVGIPVVVSPVGMNIDVLGKGSCGFSANSRSQWVEKLIELIDDASKRKLMGQTGRSIVECFYSRKILGPKLATIIYKVA